MTGYRIPGWLSSDLLVLCDYALVSVHMRSCTRVTKAGKRLGTIALEDRVVKLILTIRLGVQVNH